MNFPDKNIATAKVFQNLVLSGPLTNEEEIILIHIIYKAINDYEAAIKPEVEKTEAELNKSKLDNIELAQCNVELSKDNERLRKALKPFEWFGVEDRLPDLAPTHNPIQVIVCYGISRYTCSAVFNDGTFYFCESVEDGDHWTDNPISCVTHWMPIPEFKAAETLEGKQV